MNTTAAPSVDPSVLRSIEDHVRSDTSREVGGVLVGTINDGVEIEASIPALRAGDPSSSINFSHRVWDDVMRTVRREHPDKQIVGWYHSTPGSGAELSEYDLFVQQLFFDDPKMVALVIDPSSGEGEWFGWQGQEVQPLESYEPAAVVAAAAAATAATATVEAEPEVDAEPDDEDEEEPEDAQKSALVPALVAILMLVAGGVVLFLALRDSGNTSPASAPTTEPVPFQIPVTSLGGTTAPPGSSVPSDSSAPQPSEPAASTPSTPTPSTTPPTSTPSAPLPGGPTGAASTYVVQPGDSLWAIAAAHYGNGARYTDILAANPGLTERLQPGMTIGLPAGSRDGLVDTE
jgi:nucleoid-associated protein YgaU/proteasome lid subunit RPN8/RPN11